MAIKKVYFLDRCIISHIGKSVMGVPVDSPEAIELIEYLREIDKPNVGVSLALSVLEGEDARVQEIEEFTKVLVQETKLLGSFFRFAHIDGTFYCENSSISELFGLEHQFDSYIKFHELVCPLIIRDRSVRDAVSIKKQILEIARGQEISSNHPVVVTALAILYGSRVAKNVFKPSKNKPYNAICDVMSLLRMAELKAESKLKQLGIAIEYLSLDKGMQGLFQLILIEAIKQNDSSYQFSLIYLPELFPKLDIEGYKALMKEI